MAIYHKFKNHYADLKKHLGKEKALALFPEYAAYPENMTLRQRADLARRLMQRMDAQLAHDAIVRIRQGHPCGIPNSERRQMQRLWEQKRDADAFLTALGCVKQPDGSYLRAFGHAKCVCPVFFQLDEYDPISITWCQCCNGHVKNSYQEITGQPVETEILRSIASGGDDCVFKITVPQTETGQ